MDALRRRLGSIGSGRSRVLERVRACLPRPDAYAFRANPKATWAPDWLVSTQTLAAVVRAFPWRGDEAKLREIAHWGAVLGDVACQGDQDTRAIVAREAARFNVAIALFDSAIDEAPAIGQLLSRALTPQRLRQRLLAPEALAARLCSPAGVPVEMIGLFDDVLVSAGRRWRHDRHQIDQLAALLEAMYRSEVGLAPDPFAAKRLPVVFIGALGCSVSNRATVALFEALGRLVHLWDDWIDLADDLRRLSPNAFLGTPRRFGGTGMIRYAATALVRLGAAKRSQAVIADALARATADVVSAADRLDVTTARKAVAFCRLLAA